MDLRKVEADRLPNEIDPDTQPKYFTQTESIVAQVHQCRGVLNTLGVAVLVGMLRWRGFFIWSMHDLPLPAL